MRIGLDLRRPDDCGVGRVALNIAHILYYLTQTLEIELILLVTTDTNKIFGEYFPKANRIVCSSKFFSNEDMFELPNFLKGKIDVFWSTQFYISPLFNCPVVTMIHDIWPVKYTKWLPNHEEVERKHGSDVLSAVNKVIKYFETEIFHRLSTYSQDLYKQRSRVFDRFMFASMYLAASKAKVIATCSNYSLREAVELMPEYETKFQLLFPFARNRALPHKKISYELDRILMVAKFDPRKNHKFFLLSLKELFKLRENGRKIEVIMIGDIGYRSFGKEIVRFGKSLSKPPHQIVFAGSITEEKLWEFYSIADLLVFPSLDEGFGLPLLEAMEAGTPALVANKGSLPEVGNSYVYYSNLLNPKVFAKEIESILEDKENAFKISKSGRDYIANKYSFQRAVLQVKEIISRLT